MGWRLFVDSSFLLWTFSRRSPLWLDTFSKLSIISPLHGMHCAHIYYLLQVIIIEIILFWLSIIIAHCLFYLLSFYFFFSFPFSSQLLHCQPQQRRETLPFCDREHFLYYYFCSTHPLIIVLLLYTLKFIIL